MTTESTGIYSPAQQIAAVKSVRPEAVSVALRELIPPTHATSVAHERTPAEFFHWMRNAKILAQYILFSAAEIERYHQLLNREIIPPNSHSVLFVLGRHTKIAHPDAGVLSEYLSVWDGSRNWMVCAFGRNEFDCLQSAVERGGHIRVGFENCLLPGHGVVAESNLELVAQGKKLATQSNRPLADDGETRILLGAT